MIVHCPLGSLPLALKTEPAIGAGRDSVSVAPIRSASRAGARASRRTARRASPSCGPATPRMQRPQPLAAAGAARAAAAPRRARASSACSATCAPAMPSSSRRAPRAASRPELADFDDTAAVLAQCDLVISVDTSVAHLAGALGRPLWVLLPFSSDWRWTRTASAAPGTRRRGCFASRSRTTGTAWLTGVLKDAAGGVVDAGSPENAPE